MGNPRGLVLFLILGLVCLSYSQDESTTTVRTTTPFPGVQYGAYCNGAILKCNTYGGTVACMYRAMNETLGYETCEQGGGVNVGKCQCQRNCRVGNPAYYEDNGEFDEERQKCVGLVGKTCSILAPDCTVNASCSQSKCVCNEGFVEQDLRCVSQESYKDLTVKRQFLYRQNKLP